MAKSNDATWYADRFNAWQGNLLGAKPTTASLHVVHALGLRPGKQALANALALRPQGVTGSEIIIACGAPQLNRMRGLVADGVFKREPHEPRGGHTVYKMVLTPKGEKAVAKADAKPVADTTGEAVKPAKPAKVKAPRKPRAAKPAAVTEVPAVQAPASDAAVNVPTGDAPQADQPQA